MRREFVTLHFALLLIALFLSKAVCFAATPGREDSTTSEVTSPWGMSHHGSHYDEGPRTKPWIMNGIGSTHFPITSPHPDVQKWFDQGHTLLHGFWPFEAERAFRWCIKLDPDCAMAYWGLSRCCSQDDERAESFLQEAVARKGFVSARERDYIDLWIAQAKVRKAKQAEKLAGEDDKAAEAVVLKAVEDYVNRFDHLLMTYPDDLEAKSLYWLELPRTLCEDAQEGFHPYRFAMESVLQEILVHCPDHVGALHYRIHNWDSRDGSYALDSCRRLSQVAPNCGHLQHMPGHVLSGIGLWHEAAIAMDSATRVEVAYMQRQFVRPDQNWNYAHNLNYLCFIQEQLGMFDAATNGLRQLAAVPRAADLPPMLSSLSTNLAAIRLLIKSEQWNELLRPQQELVTWDLGSPIDRFLRGYARTYALIETGRLPEAEQELQSIKDTDLSNPLATPPQTNTSARPSDQPGATRKTTPPGFSMNLFEKFVSPSIKIQELEGKLLVAQGRHLEGISKLTAAAEAQAEIWTNDPPLQSVYLYNTLGDAYLEIGSMRLAIVAFQKTLDTVRNDGFALSGLVRAHAALQEQDEAQVAMSKLKAVWSGADRPNRRLELAFATGIDVPTDLSGPIVERDYKKEVYDLQGPSRWTPPSAPDFTVYRSSGQQVHRSDFLGKNLVLIFYQGGQCLHCMEQMRDANAMVKPFEELDTAIVAVSKDDALTIQGYEDEFDVTILSDPDFTASRACHSFDDFEEIELHSTLLIDKSGNVHWSQHGGEPFTDFGFLKSEIEKLNRKDYEAH